VPGRARIWQVKHLVRGRLVTNRTGVTALAALAMLNVFTLGAGLAVVHLLPARLALWQVPSVAKAPLAAPGSVLPPAGARGAEPTRRRLAAALGPLAASHSLGQHAGMVVTDLASGSVLFSRQATSGFVPASSAKLLTAVAALSTFGPSARFTTRVVAGPPGSLILVGGGDPALAAGPPPGSDYPQPATLASLAAASARWLRAHGEHRVRLAFDTSLFTGPQLAPGWTSSYIGTGNVTPITSLEVDQGRLTPAGTPQDADNPDNFRPRSYAPAQEAAGAFALFLRRNGIRVAGPPHQARRSRGATAVAAVRSPTLSAIVGWMLRESNNVIAEDLARQVALATGRPASFSGGAAAITAALGRLGVRHGIHMVDGSGLSPLDRVTPQALASVVRLAAWTGQPGLRSAITGMPVAGFSGTLAPGQSVFGSFGPQALGMVRAKTGNLSKVASLTGITDDASGHLLAFAFMTDQIRRASQLTAAASAIDAMATALAGCGCH
jgi:D-alanyl-D-alanine carboxypeptidase/D-alanyl-D-alanine-endopeptidase (penicillin-binding protein 4)